MDSSSTYFGPSRGTLLIRSEVLDCRLTEGAAMSVGPAHNWPKEAFTVGNAGVLLVGRSLQLGDVPVVLLGGRWCTGRQVYNYTDFGDGVDRKHGEMPRHGALRELAEELLSQDEEKAAVTANSLCESISSTLVGALSLRPFIHKRTYAIFIVPAEAVVEQLSMNVAEGMSAIDNLFATATCNKELTSVALISIKELLRGSARKVPGSVSPLSVRQLDGATRDSDTILLRTVMVGDGGSIRTVKDILERIVHDPSLLPQPEAVSAEKRATAEEEEMAEVAADLARTEEPAPRKNHSKLKAQKRRWQRNLHGHAGEALKPMLKVGRKIARPKSSRKRWPVLPAAHGEPVRHKGIHKRWQVLDALAPSVNELGPVMLMHPGACRCVVLCPRRRYHMFKAVRERLAQAGFHPSCILRREGFDISRRADIPRRKVVTKYILCKFLPELRRWFNQVQALEYVFYVEDDCKLKGKVRLNRLYLAARAAQGSIGWLGYSRRRGVPRFGTHLLSFSRHTVAALEWLRMTNPKYAFDTTIYRMCKEDASLVRAPPESLAVQVRHAMKGRR